MTDANRLTTPVEKEAGFSMFWSRETVPLEAIERALYELADRVTGEIFPVGDCWRVTLYPRGTEDGVEDLAARLRQEVTDQTLRLRIAQRTDPIRNVVFALAFSRSGLIDSHGDA